MFENVSKIAGNLLDSVTFAFVEITDKLAGYVQSGFETATNYVVAGLQGLMDAAVPTAMAAIDLDAVETSLTAAQTSGESVGALVIGVVAALVVVSIVIGLVKKL